MTASQTCLAALAAGWTRPVLSAIHQAVNLSSMELVPGGWGLVGNHRLLYRSYTPWDVSRALQDHDDNEEAVAYTDGSGTTGDKPAGIGVVVYRHDRAPELIAQNIGRGSNNCAELTAIWCALRAVPNVNQRLLIKSDSQYSIGALTLSWVRNANVELIAHIRQDLSYRPNVRFEHCDGHAGVEGNEVCDRLANCGRKLVTRVSVY